MNYLLHHTFAIITLFMLTIIANAQISTQPRCKPSFPYCNHPLPPECKQSLHSGKPALTVECKGSLPLRKPTMTRCKLWLSYNNISNIREYNNYYNTTPSVLSSKEFEPKADNSPSTETTTNQHHNNLINNDLDNSTHHLIGKHWQNYMSMVYFNFNIYCKLLNTSYL